MPSKRSHDNVTDVTAGNNNTIQNNEDYIESYSCSYQNCELSFMSLSALHTHVKLTHWNILPAIQCPEITCPFSFPT